MTCAETRHQVALDLSGILFSGDLSCSVFACRWQRRHWEDTPPILHSHQPLNPDGLGSASVFSGETPPARLFTRSQADFQPLAAPCPLRLSSTATFQLSSRPPLCHLPPLSRSLPLSRPLPPSPSLHLRGQQSLQPIWR